MKRHLIFLTVCFIAITLFPAGSPRRAQSAKPKGRALLVGINHYQHAPLVKPTRGAEEDAIETAKFIQSQYGFREDEIHKLLGKDATAANIRAEFQSWLINGTAPGDRIFFLYAGHGSQIKDTNGDEADGLDEVLAPYDVALGRDKHNDFTLDNVIVDDEIDEWIQQLSGRQAVLVFDSCNSGTISRGGGQPSGDQGDARYLPKPEDLAQLSLSGTRGGGAADYSVQDGRILRPQASSSGRTTGDTLEADNQDNRDLKLVDVKRVGPGTGIVVVSATRATQIAYSLWVPEAPRRQRGALSYVFAEAQRARQLPVRQLRQELRDRIAGLQRAKRLAGVQVPQIEVISTVPLEDQPLFGSPPAAVPNPLPAVAVGNPQSSIKLTLQTREGKTVYRIGESVSYQFTTNATGYLYLIVFSEMDVATCIFPNEHLKSNRFEVGIHVITRDGREGFGVTEPEGKDVVVALLSATPLNLGGNREAYTWNEVFAILKDARFGEYIRSRGQTAQKPAQLANWQAVSLVLETVK